MRWTLDRIAAHLGVAAHGVAEITSVTTDSRTAAPGGLFVAIQGEVHDGNEFIAEAIAGGCVAAVAGPGRLPERVPGIEVEDPLWALGGLGSLRRSELSCPVVAITGSTGKTTTKDFTAAVIGPGTSSAPRSYNNEIGVPLTVLACPDDAIALVVEVGSRGVGHIRSLGPMIHPDVAVITNIGPAHLEMFGDVETVRLAKSELLDLLGPEGVAVVPAGERDALGFPGKTITFGNEPSSDVRYSDLSMDTRGRAGFLLELAGDSVKVSLGVAGIHQAENAAAAVAVAVALGEDFSTAAGRLDGVVLSPWRMDVQERSVPGGTVVVVNDAYNANPTSMRSALETVAGMPGHHVAVLGMMHELGGSAAELHEEVGSLASALGFDVVVVGEDPGIARGAGSGAISVPGVAEARDALADLIRPGDVVLVKASRAAGLEAIPDLIGEEAA